MAQLSSLRLRGTIWVIGGLLAGGLATWLWMASVISWKAYLDRAEAAGHGLYYTLRDGTQPPAGLEITPLPADQAALADHGAFASLTGAPKPALLTYATLANPGPPGSPRLSTPELSIAILSASLRYPVASLQANGDNNPARALAGLTRRMAAYCSQNPLVVARYGAGGWYLADGRGLWSCAAAPRDSRLAAAALLAVALIALLSSVSETSARFRAFARALHQRHRAHDSAAYELSGPAELRETQEAVNAYLARERAALAQRASVLSGISHDLGTPATRLRLRAALIENDDLREKLEGDIDKMTGMIESVLTYTRSELNAEAPRRISLLSLVESVVADYQDLGQPVTLVPFATAPIKRATSVFASRRAGGSIMAPENHPVLTTARPVSLGRALSNLIDNALKYGRHAKVSLSATSQNATIVVEDEGTELSAAELSTLVAPFQRGQNTVPGGGFGLGLTIVATIAGQHGGKLSFESTGSGMRAVLTIARG